MQQHLSTYTRELSQTLSKFPNNLFYKSTAPLSFEAYPEDLYTIPLFREHPDSCLYNIDTHSLVATPGEPPFSIPFTSHINHSENFRKNIHPNNIYIPIAKVFTTFLNNLQEKINLLPKHVFNPSSIQTLLQKVSLFDLPNIEQLRTIENNPHHWLTTDILRIHHFQYQFFQNLTLNTSTKEQFQMLSFSLRNFFGRNYQLVWHSQFTSACINFPQQFTNDKLLPFIDTSDNHHPQYYNLLKFLPSHFAYLTYDSNSIDKSLNLPPPNRPYAKQHPLPPSIDTTSNVSLQTLPSSSNVIVKASPTTNQNFPPSTSQTTTTTENISTSHTPNQNTTPSNTPPVIPSNTVQLPVYQLPTIPPIPPSLNNTLSTQPLTQKSPIYFPQNPSLINQNASSSLPIPPNPSNSQTSISNFQSTLYNP